MMNRIKPVGTEIPNGGTDEYRKYMKDLNGTPESREFNMFKRASDFLKIKTKVDPKVIEELQKKSIECGYGIEAESRYGRE